MESLKRQMSVLSEGKWNAGAAKTGISFHVSIIAAVKKVDSVLQTSHVLALTDQDKIQAFTDLWNVLEDIRASQKSTTLLKEYEMRRFAVFLCRC